MVDKVKPLKFEDSIGGTEYDVLPTETDPSEDYVSGKGFSFEDLDEYLLEKVGGVLKFKFPNFSEKPIYTGDNITAYEIYDGTVQTTINRRVRTDLTYVGDLITAEVTNIYSPSDGTTILRTITGSYTYSGDDLIKTDWSEV